MITNSHATVGHLASLLGNWRSAAGGSGYSALADRIRLLVLDGRLSTGTRVPSERQLADALHLSRGTVAAAYERLRETGYLSTRRGAGSWTVMPDIEYPGAATPFVPHLDGDSIDLAHAASGGPTDLVHAATLRAAEELPRYVRGHGYDALGLLPLRRAIAARLTARGMVTDSQEVMVTSGAQQAFMLALHALAQVGDRVLVEHPLYPNALRAIEHARTRPVPVPLDEHGWDRNLFASTLREANPRMALLVPDYQNPTGLLMPAEQRAEIVELARRSGTLLIIDETLAEIRLDGPLERPFATFGGPARGDVGVLTVGSLSKVVWGGLRIGWIRGPRAVLRRIATARASVDLSGPMLEQLVAADVLGHVDEHLPGWLTELRARRDHLIDGLSRQLPSWRPSRPHGGLSLWIDLGAPASSALAMAAARRGLELMAGPRFGVGGVFESFLRLPFVQPKEVLDEALPRLADSWHALGHLGVDESTAPTVI